MQNRAEVLKKTKQIFTKGDVEIVGSDNLTKEGFLMISRFLARKTYLTPATKLIWGAVLSHAWNEKDSCFPARISKAPKNSPCFFTQILYKFYKLLIFYSYISKGDCHHEQTRKFSNKTYCIS